MVNKITSKVLLVSLTIFSLFLFFGAKKVFAQEQSPTPSPTPSCESTVDGTPTTWVYAIGGGSRTRTVPLLDSVTGGDCGSRVETEYPYCAVDGEFSTTGWAAAGQAPQNSTPGQCGGGLSTITICYQGKTLEVLNNGEELSSYRGYTQGACPTPEPTPLSCGGNQHPDAAGVNCVSFSDPGGGNSGGGTTSTGQVLGASTLAATGDGGSALGIALMVIGSVVTLSSLYVFKKSSL